MPRAPSNEPSQLLMELVSEFACESMAWRFVKTVLTSLRDEGRAETAVMRRRREENQLIILNYEKQNTLIIDWRGYVKLEREFGHAKVMDMRRLWRL